MNLTQLTVMKLKLSPAKKLTLVSMLERPGYNRRQLAEFMNIDKTQLTSTARDLHNMGLIRVERVDDSASVRYVVLVKPKV